MTKLLSLLSLAFLCLPSSHASALCSAPSPALQAKDENPKDKGVTGRFVAAATDGNPVMVAEYLAHADPKTPLFLLFHDGSLNQAEYRYIAPKLNRMGFNCMVPDLRAGDTNLGHKNKTKNYALRLKLDGSILAARNDMEGVLKYARESYPETSIILMGCSYSAAHSLRLAGEMGAFVDGVVAFSPADIFGSYGKSKTWIEEGMPDVKCPVLILSKGVEKEEWEGMFAALPEGKKHSFALDEGMHGVRALAGKSPGSKKYWKALNQYLDLYFPRASAAGKAGKKAEPKQPAPSADKHVSLERMVVIGASMSLGFFLPAGLGPMLDASCEAEHEPVRAMTEGTFAWNSIQVAKKEIAFAQALDPTLLVAADFLFWLGYGSVNAKGEILTTEAERLELLEEGLGYLESFDCPIVVGDFPDMSHAAHKGGMLAERQVPKPETLALLNARLESWSKERGQVMLLPLSKLQAQMNSGEPFRMGNYQWPAGSESRVLQGDRLHPTLEGLAAITHCIGLGLVQRGWSRPGEWNLDLASVLAKFDRELVGVEALKSLASRE